MSETRRKWLYQVLEKSHNSTFGYVINISLMVLIFLNVVSIVAASEQSIHDKYAVFFRWMDLFALVVFTIEYFMRIWVSIERESKDERRPIMTRLRYMITPMALVDLLAILPSYLLFLGHDFLILRALRLIRVFKLTRYSRSMELLTTVFKQEAETILSAIFVLMILIVISASGIHIVEGKIQPEEFGSIPRALWWATVTLTTVGYGDVVPVTGIGRALGILIVITGVGMAALPAGILAAGFTSEVTRRREHFKTALMVWVEDGTFSKHENSEFIELRLNLGISRTDAAIMLREARAINKRNKVKKNNTSVNVCPNCGFDHNEHAAEAAKENAISKDRE
ncbi:ion transporter [Cocleimonas flava]|uniref:Voltage-gated potassium channel n=1 Tax=Cocleimonas flava TaxID=634765 RepID=A0A4V6NCH5_9GAMM|nr:MULTISPECIES: ion transporter [Cocleimonas]MEB8431603.1 ion transporter [Cocleimonas sp. KMM 6892]MEC4713625.1 ion transporter [Cocleimonas sp. KMM 6895]MEC4742956.1 ion transporter [Cocleimonas sp. KMM 6896]TCJ89285.1 voltage-gated potassium channel [Cocleimonas flava]